MVAAAVGDARCNNHEAISKTKTRSRPSSKALHYSECQPPTNNFLCSPIVFSFLTSKRSRTLAAK